MSVNWGYINNVVFEGLSAIKDSNRPLVIDFLSWYDIRKNKPINVKSEEFKKWVIEGIPKVKDIVDAIKNQIRNTDNILEKIYTSNANVDTKITNSKYYRVKIKNLNDLINLLLGCQENVNKLFIGWLQAIEQTSVVKQAIDYFNTQCLPIRMFLLKSQTYYYYF